MLKCCFLVNTKKKPSYFIPFSSASIADFEQVNVWVTVNRGPFQKNSSMHTERLLNVFEKNTHMIRKLKISMFLFSRDEMLKTLLVYKH